MFLRKVRVRKHERGLWFRHGEFRKLLGPGVHYFAGRLLGGGRDEFCVASTLATLFEHPQPACTSGCGHTNAWWDRPVLVAHADELPPAQTRGLAPVIQPRSRSGPAASRGRLPGG